MKTYFQDKLKVNIYDSRTAMGAAAAEDIVAKIKELLAEKDEISMIFAAAPSQNEVLASLVADKSIEWNRINAYHMDEYIGLDSSAPQCFGNFLDAHIFGLVPFKSVNYIKSDATDPDEESARYSSLLAATKIDIVVMGIGENGHIAFNDPPADFNTHEAYIIVNLDERCKRQQMGEGWFATMDDVPKQAVSMSVYQIMECEHIISAVPHAEKSWAVANTLNHELTNLVPGTMLKTHKNFQLFVDANSYAEADEIVTLVGETTVEDYR